MTVREIAKALGVSHVAVIKAFQTGRIPRETDGSYNLEKVKLAWEANTNPSQSRRARTQQRTTSETPPGTTDAVAGEIPEGSIAEANRRKEWLTVQDKQLTLERKRGEIASVAEVNAFVSGMIIRAKDIMLRIGPELRDKLANETSAARIEALINAEVNRALREMQEYRPSIAA